MGVLTRIFLLSPANCSGARATRLLSPGADFLLARRLCSRKGAALGDVFAFVSGLYFRGKLTYARRFAAPADSDSPGVYVITPNAGLRDADTPITRAALRSFGGAAVHPGNAAYRRPLERSARALAGEIGSDAEIVLLGSIASPKYVSILLEIFCGRLRFPVEFIGRGDMSRGGLLLRTAANGCELEYAPVAGAVLRGARPPKLPPLRRPR
jgi:hypothetical protein